MRTLLLIIIVLGFIGCDENGNSNSTVEDLYTSGIYYEGYEFDTIEVWIEEEIIINDSGYITR